MFSEMPCHRGGWEIVAIARSPGVQFLAMRSRGYATAVILACLVFLDDLPYLAEVHPHHLDQRLTSAAAAAAARGIIENVGSHVLEVGVILTTGAAGHFEDHRVGVLICRDWGGGRPC